MVQSIVDTQNQQTPPFVKHPFLGKHVKLTPKEQQAIDLEKRYENLLVATGKYHIRKDSSRLKDVRREIKVLKRQLDELWDQIRKEALEVFKRDTR